MPESLGFDIYGTLVGPLEMNEHLRVLVGEKADRFSQLWREKQIEYTWRRRLMREYADFGVCTRQTLDLTAFSNSVEQTARVLLGRGGVLDSLEAVVSVDGPRTFKPDPEAYRYLARWLDRTPEETWLVSSNAWDVTGAKSAGLRAAWVRRSPDNVYDPWGIEPDLVVENLEQLAGKL